MFTKLGRMVTYFEGLLTIKSFFFFLVWALWSPHRFDHGVFQDDVTSQDHYNSTTRPLMATKLDRMVTYFDGLLPIKPNDPLIASSCEIT